MINCEFCAEFQTDGPARFRSLYKNVAAHRIVARSARFVAVPTIGQMFEGSFLILPIEHVETCAIQTEDARAEMLSLTDEMITHCSAFGKPIVFEHGATSAEGGGCGIYHAHLHVVPIPTATAAAELFPEATEEVVDLAAAWRTLHGSPHYLLLGDGKSMRIRDLSTNPGVFPSQFFRRRLSEFFSLKTSWDWRSYPAVEQSMLRVLKRRATHAG
ncbi:HIT family protein [Acetobacter orientalis]|uniref:HIT family protein n=1 Tax=Acetobacter orientalis TaxID=146474 RepID=UPI0039E86E3C